MTMADGDWGIGQWDVDSTAESLNKSLFGKKRTKGGVSRIKPDLAIDEKKETDFGHDSGDDDDGTDKLSKKAKKKLKEKRRKENVRIKKNKALNKESQEDESGGDKMLDGDNDGRITKQSKISLKKAEKKKGKLKEKESELKTKPNKALKKEHKVFPEKKTKLGKRKASHVIENKDLNGDVILAKQKKTEKGNEITDSHVLAKQNKTEKENEITDSHEEDTSRKKKKNRKKKKKPSSKKNKYKHLGLKSDRSAPSDNDSDDELDERSKKDCSKPNSTSVSKGIDASAKEKGKKRKRSFSPDPMPVKKALVLEESKSSDFAKLAKGKKHLDVSQTIDVEKSDGRDFEEKKLKKSKAKPQNMAPEKEEKVEGSNISDTKISVENVAGKLMTSKKEKGKRSKEDIATSDAKSKVRKVEEETSSSVSPFFSSQGMEMQQRFKEKLVSGRFRFINEQLYTIKGGEAFRMFQQDKTLMDAYNTGFQSQVAQWPVNPLDVIIKQLKNKKSHLKVADFGCGEARLSASVPQKVYSFDLYALNKRVTVSNMAKTPLEDESVDIAVYCLSLMGTNLNDYLLEANRVLKEDGILKIAEVVSRFTNINNFVNAVSSMGFKSLNSRDLSKMFYLMDFKKVKSVKKSSKSIKDLSLSPCVYKKR